MGPDLQSRTGAWVLPLADPAAAVAADVGSKAASLASLMAAGFRVPPGFVIPTSALDAFLDAADLSAPRARLDAALARGELPSDDALAAFRAAVCAAPLPPGLQDALGVAARDLPAGAALAVRSSGTREDLGGASFAGLYLTELGVRGEAALHDAIRRCWASMWDPRVLEYALGRGGGAQDLGMGVIVQQLVDAEVSGVLFTVDPRTGHEDRVLVEAVFGLGEALVSGRVTPDRYALDARTGEVVDEAISSPGARTLDAEALAALARTSAELHDHYGRPMDGEWVMSGGVIWWVQARPITSIAFAPELGEWTTANLRDGGVASDVCCPFVWSLYGEVLERSLPGYLAGLGLVDRDQQARWSRLFFGRPYWNLGEVKRALARLPGFDEAAFHADLGVDVAPGFEGRRTPLTVGRVLRALPSLFALLRVYRSQLVANRAWVAGFDARKAPWDLEPAALASLDPTTFVSWYEALLVDLYPEAERAYFITFYNTSNAQTDFRRVFSLVTALSGGELDELTLLTGLKDLSHLRPMKDLHRLAGAIVTGERALDDATIDDFAWRWRHLGRKQLDPRVPRWVEDRAFVARVLEEAVEAWRPEQDPARDEALLYEQYVAMRRRALELIGWRRPLLRGLFVSTLDRIRTWAWWREEMRDRSNVISYLVRTWTTEAARRLTRAGVFEAPDDVWYLPVSDTLAALRGQHEPDTLRRRIREGRRAVRAFRNFDNPPEIGAHFGSAGDRAPSATALQGTACAPGRATGRACVVRSLEEAPRLQRGEILVTQFTDPGWTPLYARVGGVITETGGVLSHSAVLAREYGIPAILGVPGATRRIRDGELITLDGVLGTVERCAGEAAASR